MGNGLVGILSVVRYMTNALNGSVRSKIVSVDDGLVLAPQGPFKT